MRGAAAVIACLALGCSGAGKNAAREPAAPTAVQRAPDAGGPDSAPEPINRPAPDARPDAARIPDTRPPPLTVEEPLFVRFPAGSDRYTPASRVLLDRMAEMIRKSPPGTVVRVEGHADRAEKNAAVLSLRRARAVRRYLLGQGAPPERVRAAGYGATRPVGGAEENRRVDFSGLDAPY